MCRANGQGIVLEQAETGEADAVEAYLHSLRVRYGQEQAS